MKPEQNKLFKIFSAILVLFSCLGLIAGIATIISKVQNGKGLAAYMTEYGPVTYMQAFVMLIFVAILIIPFLLLGYWSKRKRERYLKSIHKPE